MAVRKFCGEQCDISFWSYTFILCHQASRSRPEHRHQQSTTLLLILADSFKLAQAPLPVCSAALDSSLTQMVRWRARVPPWQCGYVVQI